MKMFLDKDNFGQVYKFIKTPQWYSVEVEIDDSLVEATALLTNHIVQLNQYLDALYEARRASRPLPEMPDHIKEIVTKCLAPAAVAPAKKQKQQATAAGSSSQ